MRMLLLIGALLFCPGLFAQEVVPAGTILPVLLTSQLTPKAASGQILSSRIMQDVPLPNGRKIRAGSRVTGHVVEVVPAANGRPATVSIVFDKLVFSKTVISITADLRALASPIEVDSAETPEVGGDRGTPPNVWVTNQVGGESVYRGGGHVMRGNQIVGEPVSGGVLARVTEKPGSPCRGAVAENNQPQAVWVFASDACGAYGYSDVNILQAGRTDPKGRITFEFEGRNPKVWSGSGMLLRVIESEPAVPPKT